jgi:hypothetical protein
MMKITAQGLLNLSTKLPAPSPALMFIGNRRRVPLHGIFETAA